MRTCTGGSPWNCSYLASINWHEFRWSRSVCAAVPVAGGGHSHVSASVLMARGKGHMGSKRGGARTVGWVLLREAITLEVGCE